MSDTKYITDVNQGDGPRGPFGYVGIEGRGGQFFDHRETLEATLESIADDELDPPVDWTGADYSAVEEFIRQQLSAGKISA